MAWNAVDVLVVNSNQKEGEFSYYYRDSSHFNNNVSKTDRDVSSKHFKVGNGMFSGHKLSSSCGRQSPSRNDNKYCSDKRSESSRVERREGLCGIYIVYLLKP